MTVHELSLRCNLSLFAPGGAHGPVARIYASNTMSDLVANAASDTLLVTSLNNNQLIRIAELMDAPGICLAGRGAPCEGLLAGAERAGKAVLVSALPLEETRLMLEAVLRGTAGAAR